MGLELLHGLGGVVDKTESSGLATTELGAETEDGDLVLAGLVQASELLAELILGDVGTVGVQDVTIQKKDQRLAKRVFLKRTVCVCPSLSRSGTIHLLRTTATRRHLSPQAKYMYIVGKQPEVAARSVGGLFRSH